MEQRILSAENIAEGTAVIIFQLIQKTIRDKGVFNIALSGGKSPAQLYEKLAAKINLIENLHLNVFQVDERYVDPYHDDSNQQMIRTHFLDLLERKNRINHFFFNTDLPIEESANLYDELMGERTIHLAIMGVGIDGHTASIFPGEKYPKIRYDKNVIFTPEFNLYKRLTMTHKCLLSCGQLLFYIPGIYKLKIVERILDPKNIDVYPASFFLHKHPDTIIIREK